MIAAAVRPLVPVDAQPLQVLQRGIRKFRFAALRVEVFRPVYEFATGLTRALVGDPKCLRVAKVKQAGGGRGDAAAIRLHAG